MDDFKEMTADSLFNGALTCFQNKNGYRFSIDSVLLAHFSLTFKKAKILDLGCGCGILGLILLYRKKCEILSIDGLELQQSLVEVARKNSAVNGFSSKFTITAGDLKKIDTVFPCEWFSHIICNPPFFRVGSGRTSRGNEEYLARHQASANISEIIAAASYALKNKGVFSLVFPAESMAELLHCLVLKRMQPKRIRLVYSYPEADSATLVLVECVKNGGVGVQILKPLYIYDKKHGDYTGEVNAMYRPNPAELDKESVESSC